MAAINDYPKYNTVEETPYFHSLQRKLLYAKEFTPHKVAYYEQQIKDCKEKAYCATNQNHSVTNQK